MSSDSDSNDDLLIRARRDALRPDEQRRLRELLPSSSQARLLFEAGCAFDREAVVLPGDDQRIERMVRAVRAREARRRAPALRRAHWQALAVGVLVGAGAVAAVGVSKSLLLPAPQASAQAAAAPRERGGHGTAPSDRAAPLSTTSGAAATSSAAARSVVVAPSTASESTPGRQPEPNKAPVVGPGASAPSSARFDDVGQNRPAAGPSQTAGELFAEANRLRVQADSARAIAAYQRLESEFPNSSEALIARLSLGMLYLQARQPNLALEQFRAYRARGQGPTLGEALWGESLALHQLKRRTEERAVLQELLDRFPDSAYANAARKRLSEP